MKAINFLSIVSSPQERSESGAEARPKQGLSNSRVNFHSHASLRSAAMVLCLLMLGLGQAWGTLSFHGANNGVKFSKSSDNGSNYSDYEIKHGTTNSTQNGGTVTNLYLKEYFVQLYQDQDDYTGGTHVYYWFYQTSSGRPGGAATSYSGNWGDWGSWDGGKRYPKFGNNNISDDGGSTNVNLLYGKGAGEYTFEYYFDAECNNGWAPVVCSNGGSNFKVTFTVPGFTTANIDKSFGTTIPVNTESETTISFTHYGTALTTGNCVLSGTNSSMFTVRSISESGVTVSFSPGSSTGAKSATLTLTDAHSKTCTISLSATVVAKGTTTKLYFNNYKNNGGWSASSAKYRFSVAYTSGVYTHYPMTQCANSTYNWYADVEIQGKTVSIDRYNPSSPYNTWNTAAATGNALSATYPYAISNSTSSYSVYATNHPFNNVTGGKIYFDNSESGFTNTLYFIIGHDTQLSDGNANTYSVGYALNNVTNTKLSYLSLSASWEDADYYAVVGASSDPTGNHSWGSGSLSDKGTGGYTTAYKSVLDLLSGNVYLASAAASNSAMTIAKRASTASSSFNSTQTIQYALSTDGGETYTVMSSGTTPGTIGISAYKFTDGTYDAVTNTSNSQSITGGTTGTYTTSVPAAYTGTTTLSASAADGYTFMGWKIGTTETNASSPCYPKEATTYTARFIQKATPTQYTVSGAEKYCSTVTITLSGSQTNASYQLYKGVSTVGDPKAGTGNALTWDVSDPGTYTVQAVQTDYFVARAMSGSATVSRYTPESITTQPTSPREAVVGEALEIGLVAAGDNNVAYQWQTCDASDASGTNTNITSGAAYAGYTTNTLSFTAASAGTYYFRCIVSDDCNNKDTSNVVTVTAYNRYTVTHTLSHATKTSGDASVLANHAYTAVYANATGYTLPANITVKFGETTKTAGTDYTWTQATGTLSIPVDKITDDVTVIITATADTYTITLDDESATTAVSPTTLIATYGSSTLASITKPKKNGYDFGGWYSGDDGTGDLVINTSGALQASTDYTDGSGNWNYEGDVTLYAKWTVKTYHIYYFEADKTTPIDGLLPNTYTYNAGAVVLPTPPDSACYSFVTWHKSTDNKPKTQIDNGSYGDYNFYGEWSLNSHTLTWDFDGGSTSATAGDDYTAGGSVNCGASLTYPANNTMSRNGYTFSGWSTNATEMPDENLTITAQWAGITYSITYKECDNSTAITGLVPTTYTCGVEAELPTPTKSGYTFDGWYSKYCVFDDTSAPGGHGFGWVNGCKKTSTDIDMYGAVTYLAKWHQTVTLDMQGIGSNLSPTVEYLGTALSGYSASNIRSGALLGYYTATSEGTKVLNADGSFADTDIDDYITDGKWTKAGATTLYAHWASLSLPETLDISNYTAYGGGLTFRNDTLDYGTGTSSHQDGYAEWKVNIAEKCVYHLTLNGYYPNCGQLEAYLINSSGTTVSTHTFTKKCDCNAFTLTETWNLSELSTTGVYTLKIKNVVEHGSPRLISLAIDPITVTYDANGGSCATSSAAYAGSAMTLPSATKSGYALMGWFNGETKIGNAGASYEPTASITLTAHWAPVLNLPEDTLDVSNYVDYGGVALSGSENEYFNYSGVSLTGYVDWKINIAEKCVYTITIDGYYHWGHSWELYLINSVGTTESTCTFTRKDFDCGGCYNTWTESKNWDLSGLDATGVYTLRIKNLVSGGDPQLLRIAMEPITVTYDANGGSCATGSAIYAGSALTLPTPTKSGYLFSGWYNGETKIGNAGGSYVPTESITLTARWTTVITVPATLDKSNYLDIGGGLTFIGDTLDYKEESGLTGYTDWMVRVTKFPYTATIAGHYHYGHQWEAYLIDGAGVTKSTLTFESTYMTGDKIETKDWDLSSDLDTAGVYTLRVMNLKSGGDPKLLSLTFSQANLALGKTPVAGYEPGNAGEHSDKVTDGDTGTAWTTYERQPVSDEWFYVDLGAIYQLNRIELVWGDVYSTDYILQVRHAAPANSAEAVDDNKWYTVAEVTDAAANATKSTSVDVTARYVRFHSLTRSSTFLRLYEFRVFGIGFVSTDNTAPVINTAALNSISADGATVKIDVTVTEAITAAADIYWTVVDKNADIHVASYSDGVLSVTGMPTGRSQSATIYAMDEAANISAGKSVTIGDYVDPIENLALNKTVEACINFSGGDSEGKAKGNDGSTDTYWVTYTYGDATNEWWYVDLGDFYDIRRIEVAWITDFHSTSYSVQYRQNAPANNSGATASEWDAISEFTSVTTGDKSADIASSVSARYICLRSASRNNDQMLKMVELRVFGKAFGTPDNTAPTWTDANCAVTDAEANTITMTLEATDENPANIYDFVVTIDNGSTTRDYERSTTPLNNEITITDAEFIEPCHTYTVTAKCYDRAGNPSEDKVFSNITPSVASSENLATLATLTDGTGAHASGIGSIIDGDTDSRWENIGGSTVSGAEGNDWLMFNWDMIYKITDVKVYWETHDGGNTRPLDYEWQVSNDGTNFRTWLHYTSKPGNDETYTLNANYQYIRLFVNEKDRYNGMCIREVEISGECSTERNLTYDANGGTGAPEPAVFTIGSATALSSTVPTRVGYTFQGWNENQDGSGATTYAAGASYTIGETDVTLYAKWSENANNFIPTEGGNWSVPGNWSNGIPTINDVVYIPSSINVDITTAKAGMVVLDQRASQSNNGKLTILPGKALTVASTVLKTTDEEALVATTAADILIQSNAANGNGALVMGDYDGTNAASVDFYTLSHGEKGSSASVNQYIGTPFTDATVLSDYYNSWMYKITYTDGEPGWTRITNGNETLNPFQGYCVISADDAGHVYEMDGTLVATTNRSLSLVNNVVDAAVNEKNENLLANSWTAPIKIDSMKTTDFTNAIATIYIFNSGSPDDYDTNGGSTGNLAGQYSTYPIGSAEGAVIPSMQSFSVYSTNSSASVSLNYERIVYNPAVAGTAASTPNKVRRQLPAVVNDETKLRIYVQAESGYADMVYMRERADFAEGFENGYDGHKIFGESVAPQLYAVTPDGNMAVNCVPDVEGTVLGFKAGTKDDEYTFTFEYDETEALYLLDTQNGTYTRVETDGNYRFGVDDVGAHNRFVLTRYYSPQTPTGGEEVRSDEGQGTKAVKIMEDNKIFILYRGVLYDGMGKRVEERRAQQ